MMSKNTITLNYYFNVNPQMKQNLQKAKLSYEVDFEATSDLTPIIENSVTIGLSRKIIESDEKYFLGDFDLSLAGYKFEGWKIVRDSHYVLPHKHAFTQVALYAGEKSIIHTTGVADSEFLWQTGENFEPNSDNYSFYAQWTPLSYKINFIARTIHGLSLDWTADSAQRTIETGFQIKIMPELHGYDFVGWNINGKTITYNNAHQQPSVPAGIGDITVIALFDDYL